MAKIYSDSPEKVEKMIPKKETVHFILNYSKALKVNKHKKMAFESVMN